MNRIVKPLTSDGMVGFDESGQLCLWKEEEGGGRIGKMIADVRKETCFICLRGWQVTAESLEDQSYNDGHAAWSHRSCAIRYGALTQFDFWYGALIEAGFIFGREKTERDRLPALESLPNGYHGGTDPWCAGMPWYRVHLLKKDVGKWENSPHGRTLRLGRRKRVWHMEIEPGTGSYDAEAARTLFAGEDVTKDIGDDRMMVHAWGRDKAREYLRHFAVILNANAWREELQKRDRRAEGTAVSGSGSSAP